MGPPSLYPSPPHSASSPPPSLLPLSWKAPALAASPNSRGPTLNACISPVPVCTVSRQARDWALNYCTSCHSVTSSIFSHCQSAAGSAPPSAHFELVVAQAPAKANKQACPLQATQGRELNPKGWQYQYHFNKFSLFLHRDKIRSGIFHDERSRNKVWPK